MLFTNYLQIFYFYFWGFQPFLNLRAGMSHPQSACPLPLTIKFPVFEYFQILELFIEQARHQRDDHTIEPRLFAPRVNDFEPFEFDLSPFMDFAGMFLDRLDGERSSLAWVFI